VSWRRICGVLAEPARTPIAEMERVLPGLRQKLIIDGAGHWVQQERADEVTAALIAFLKENAN
jgi:pimeloyl-ACP methyl ester carboxylesterase